MSKTVTFIVRDNVDLNQLQVSKDNGGAEEVLYQLARRPAIALEVSFDENED